MEIITTQHFLARDIYVRRHEIRVGNPQLTILKKVIYDWFSHLGLLQSHDPNLGT